MGKIINLGVSDVFVLNYIKPKNNDSWFGWKTEYKFNEQLNTEDTYIAIYGPSQQEQLTKLKKENKVKIIYESKKALNWNMGAHGPRNTVVIFELVDDGKGN